MQETTFQSSMANSTQLMNKLYSQRSLCAAYFKDLDNVRQSVMLMMIGALSMAIITKIINGMCSMSEQRRKDNSESKDIEKCLKDKQEAYYDNIID